VLARSAWRDRRIVLNLYGDGPDREALAAEARERGLDNVRFAARVADMRDIWRANHGILLSSFMEGLPIVLVGAMLARRVPIVTDVGGHAELIEDNLSGFIARRPDADAFAEAMERAFRRLDNWPAIGEAARRAALAVVPEDPVGHFVERLVDTAHASRRRLAAAE
jgi:glycosyltransferase involved in cell wall biosynthesis